MIGPADVGPIILDNSFIKGALVIAARKHIQSLFFCREVEVTGDGVL
jgi:hypothetical protein